MFHKRPYSRSRIFRTESDAPLPSVRERIHFFFYYVGSIADAPLKQFRVFEQRSADLRKPKSSAQVPQDSFHIPPGAHFRRQDILSPPRQCRQHDNSPLCAFFYCLIKHGIYFTTFPYN